MSEEKKPKTTKRDTVGNLLVLRAVKALCTNGDESLFDDKRVNGKFFTAKEIHNEVLTKAPGTSDGTTGSALHHCANAEMLISFSNHLLTNNLNVFAISPYVMEHGIEIANGKVSAYTSKQSKNAKAEKEAAAIEHAKIHENVNKYNPAFTINFEVGDAVCIPHENHRGKIIELNNKENYMIVANSNGERCSVPVRTENEKLPHSYVQLIAKYDDQQKMIDALQAEMNVTLDI